MTSRSRHLVSYILLVRSALTSGAKAKIEALIEAELAQTPRVAEDDPRLGHDVDVFPVSLQ